MILIPQVEADSAQVALGHNILLQYLTGQLKEGGGTGAIFLEFLRLSSRTLYKQGQLIESRVILSQIDSYTVYIFMFY